MHGACTKRPYFHFRSKIWRHYRVPRPRFPEGRENVDHSRTFKTDIGLIFAWVFRTSWPKMGFSGDKIGEGAVRYWPPNELVLPFGCSYVGENRSRSATVRVLADGQIHTLTDWLTDANRFYNMSHAICYSYGTDNKTLQSVAYTKMHHNSLFWNEKNQTPSPSVPRFSTPTVFSTNRTL